jgi:ABC-type transporter Mla subunit MlaD
MNRRIRDVIVTIFVLGGIGLAIFAYIWFSGRMASHYGRVYTVVFRDVAGLKVGDPVQVLGIEKGKVTRIELVGGHVEVKVAVARDFRPRTRGSQSAQSATSAGTDT